MRIHEADEGILVYTDEGKARTGHFADYKAAEYAAEFSDQELQQLWDSANQGEITYEMMRQNKERKSKP